MRKMKDSGISSFGRVPEKWNTTKLKNILSLRSIKSGGKGELLSVYLDRGVIAYDESDGQQVHKPSNDMSNYQIVHIDDFVLNNQQAWRGSVGVSEYEGIISPAYFVYDIDDGCYGKYMNYLLRDGCMVQQYEVASRGVGTIQRNLFAPWFLNSWIVIPEYKEQKRVADYLDTKCAEIDALTADIQSEIDILEAYKRSVITEAVTKGLDKNVKMKKVNNTWIQNIPESWKLLKTGYLFVERSVKASGDETPLSLSQKDGLVKTDDMVEHSMKSKTYDGWKRVWPNDLVLNRFKAHLGVFFCSKYTGMVSFHYGVYVPKVKLNVKYYEYLYHSKPYCEMFAEMSNGITVGLQNLGNATFYSAKSVFPPYDEQNKIVGYLDKTCSEIDSIIVTKNEQIETLAEYKKALIYDYVTGKKEV